MIATYKNFKLNEVYNIGGISNFQHALEIYKFVCKKNNWNPDTFLNDVKITVKKEI